MGSAYSQGKRAAEHLAALYSDRYGLEVTVARCFSFVGRDLPLEAHFAIGNFIHDALNGKNIFVKGDGSPVRSYMDQRDLAAWLERILVFADPGSVYNVGSDEALSIADLATTVRDILAPERDVIFGNAAGYPNRNIYVPNIKRAREDLGLSVSVGLNDAISAFKR